MSVADFCASIFLGRLSLCLPVDVAIIRGDTVCAAQFYRAATADRLGSIISTGVLVACVVDLAIRSSQGIAAAQYSLCFMLAIFPFAVYSGRHALDYMQANASREQTVKAVPSDAVLQSFVQSHFCEAIAAFAVLAFGCSLT